MIYTDRILKAFRLHGEKVKRKEIGALDNFVVWPLTQVFGDLGVWQERLCARMYSRCKYCLCYSCEDLLRGDHIH